MGGEWRKEELVNAGLKNGQDEATHKALFVQDEFALGQNLMATLGLRGDHHAIFGSEVSPRAYLVWEASPTLVVKGGYGHAFKAPTLKQISPNYVGAEGPHSFLGNGNIQPETSNAFELGANWQAAPQLALRATVFHTEVKQLITYRLLQKSARAAFTSTTTWMPPASKGWKRALPGTSPRACNGTTMPPGCTPATKPRAKS